MARVKRGVQVRARHKKIVKMAAGYRGRSKNCFRLAIQRVEKALQYAYRDRRTKKRDFRTLWIQRINAAARNHGLTYATFMHALSKAGVNINRKILADIATSETQTFKELVKTAKKEI